MGEIKVSDLKLTAEDMDQVKGGGLLLPAVQKVYDDGDATNIGSSTGGAGGAGKVKFDRLTIKK